MNELVTTVITSSATIVSGTILFMLKRFLTRQQKLEEERDLSKARENSLVLRSIIALGKLTVANSIALRDGKSNGEMTSALHEYETVVKDLYDYLISSRPK